MVSFTSVFVRDFLRNPPAIKSKKFGGFLHLTNGVETADFTYYADCLRKTKDGELYIYDGKNVLAEIDNTDIGSLFPNIILSKKSKKAISDVFPKSLYPR